MQEAIGQDLESPGGDCEAIPHPKNAIQEQLKRRDPPYSFDEKSDGTKILGKINLAKVLKHPDHQQSLRTLVKWFFDSLAAVTTDQPEVLDHFDLPRRLTLGGCLAPTTASQPVFRPPDL